MAKNLRAPDSDSSGFSESEHWRIRRGQRARTPCLEATSLEWASPLCASNQGSNYLAVLVRCQFKADGRVERNKRNGRILHCESFFSKINGGKHTMRCAREKAVF